MAYIKLCNLLFLLFCLILTAFVTQGSITHQEKLPNNPRTSLSTGVSHLKIGSEAQSSRNARRLMIGSTAPTCTYNECRGCKYKCRAEQVPVEGNDPIHSAYHYKCVCHR
ncbi:EPIDERMAL PATTERNING FACTOR-like protein 9 [Manihot esculenta]|uniref:Stomagen C-terminal domain-containing protein n=1 Tax=Manihot esculenta TaxID=3983 RepID=A0A2C9UTI9_MANES|nr:EPIDERMAL PATTERNING FACTOR-like protein 9 [Manihot esculenta]OAY34859.1 hypothetical protein MANES_12G052500v8 [Manihot esculenta]